MPARVAAPSPEVAAAPPGIATAKMQLEQIVLDQTRRPRGGLLACIVTGTPAAWGPGRARVPASLSLSQARAQAQTRMSPEQLALSAAAAMGTLSSGDLCWEYTK